MSLEALIDFLINERLSRGITQAELAERIGRARVTIVQWENGYYYPTALMLQKWVKALGYTLDFKISGGPWRPPD